MKTKLPQGYELTGPFFKYSSPYGTVSTSMNRREYFLSRNLTPEEIDDPKTSEFRKITKSVTLGVIIKFDNQPKRFIIDQLFPIISFPSLKKAINFLIEEEGKLVFCT